MNRETARRKAEALVAAMTVEEAAAQLSFGAPAIERLGVPAYNWWNETLHGVARAGVATSFPQAIGMAASFDADLLKRLADVAATEGRAKYNAYSAEGDRDIYKGLTFWSPNINIFRDPRWGRGHETYGEDPYLTAQLGKAYVEGLQGDGETMKTAACAKHFAVHSGPEALRHRFDAKANAKDMWETYLPAFRELVVDAKVESVMGAYNRTNGEACCGHSYLMGDVLRGQWDFQGHFVSDCWAIRDFHENHMVTDSPEESAALALKSGCDLNCGNTYTYMMKAYAQGLISEEDIRRSAVRLFTTRYLLGILEGSEFDSIGLDKVECKEHLDTAKEATEKACVLLKNNGMLPLRKEQLKTLAVIGPNADSRVALIGNYHGTSSRYVTVLEGIQDQVGDDVRVVYSSGCHLFKDREEPLAMANDREAEAVAYAKTADAVVLVVGLDETLEGEEGDTGNAAASGDKADLLLPASQRSLMRKVMALGKPTVIVLMAGSSIDLEEAGEQADAVLLTWYPGARGGKTVADILFGEVSPSGKLPVTFYHNSQLAQMPDFTDYSMRGRTYRYLEQEPLYPFGYGLTYGDVHVDAASAAATEAGAVISAKVCNTGSRATQEVVQVYVQNVGDANAPRNPRLCAVQRVTVAPGEKVTVELSVERSRWSVVDPEGKTLPGTAPTFYVGVGQPDSRTEALTGHASVVCTLN